MQRKQKYYHRHGFHIPLFKFKGFFAVLEFQRYYDRIDLLYVKTLLLNISPLQMHIQLKTNKFGILYAEELYLHKITSVTSLNLKNINTLTVLFFRILT